MPETTLQRLITLQRYYVAATFARKHFYAYVGENSDAGDLEGGRFPEYWALMSWWYASLWVVLDGWPQMGIDDPEMTRVVTKEKLDKLKDFRDATMHYRPGYIDAKHRPILADPKSVEWINAAQKTVGDAILRALSAERPDLLPDALRVAQSATKDTP